MTAAAGRQTVALVRPAPSAIGPGSVTAADARVLLTAIAIVLAMVAGQASGFGQLTTVAVAGALLAAVVAPMVGLSVLAFSASMQDPGLIPAPGFSLVLVGAVLLGCVYRLPIDRPLVTLRLPALLLLGFVGYVTVQQLPAMLSGYSGQAAHDIGYLYIQLMGGFGVVVACGYLLAGRSPTPVIAMALLGASLASCLAIVSSVAPDVEPLYARLLPTIGDSSRPSATFANPNFFGAYAAMMLAAAAGLATSVRSLPVRSLLIATAVLLGGAVIVSQSRGGLLAAIVGLACLALVRSRRLALVVLGLGLVTATVIYPAFVEWRLQNILGSASAAAYAMQFQSDEVRLRGVLAGLELVQLSPLFGVGFGRYSEASVQVTEFGRPIAAHNWYANVTGELGMVGLVLWVIFLMVVLVELRARPVAARSVGFAVLGAFGAACLFLEAPGSFQTIAAPAMILTAALVAGWDSRDNDRGIAVASAAIAPGPRSALGT